ncbi:MAG TPA: hypothetical protein VMI73_11285 [Trebonia sp.]|nr:hypothetical protein [Trebonia sp.]
MSDHCSPSGLATIAGRPPRAGFGRIRETVADVLALPRLEDRLQHPGS